MSYFFFCSSFFPFSNYFKPNLLIFHIKMIFAFSGLEMFFYLTTLLFSDGFKDQNEGNNHPFQWTERNLEKSWASTQNTGIPSKGLFAYINWNFLKIFHCSETLDGQDDFFIKHVQATDGSEAFLFISPSLLENLGEVTELHADGTFRTVPPMFHQLFTLHFSRFGQVSCRFNLFEKFFTELSFFFSSYIFIIFIYSIFSIQIFPFVFALMTSKSRVLYDAIFQCVLEEFAERFPNKEVNITNFMSDYEQAIQGAAMEAFGCRTTGCFFHYSQVIT